MTPPSGSQQAPGADSGPDALAPFRPRRGRTVALVVAWLSLVVFGVIAVVMPAQADGRWGRSGWSECSRRHRRQAAMSVTRMARAPRS